MARLLVQPQLSNYYNGKFDLSCDSGWNMMLGRIVEMLRHDQKLEVGMLVPERSKVHKWPERLAQDLPEHCWHPEGCRINFIEIPISTNAIVTRYEFNYDVIARAIQDAYHVTKQFTHVLINDPMLLRNYKALFSTTLKYRPKFITFSHFIDNPEAPKFPEEVSMWYGQVEAALRSDWNFWQCESALEIFLGSMAKHYQPQLVELVKGKSTPWDDGYSSTEVNTPITEDVGFNLIPAEIDKKVIVFVPNRVGDGVRSSDYTNCGRFLFDWVNKLYEKRQDFIVIAGNPNQKISNVEISERCKPYIRLVPDTFTRNEYRFAARKSDIVVGLYDKDAYGATAWRECIDLGCLPLSPNIYEYKRFFDETKYPFAVKPDFSDVCDRLSDLIDYVKAGRTRGDFGLAQAVRARSSYESTTPEMMRKVGLL